MFTKATDVCRKSIGGGERPYTSCLFGSPELTGTIEEFQGFIPHRVERVLADWWTTTIPPCCPSAFQALCEDCRFQLTTFATRYGLQNYGPPKPQPGRRPISGLASLIYAPEVPRRNPVFKSPWSLRDTDGCLLVRTPRRQRQELTRVQGPLVTQPRRRACHHHRGIQPGADRLSDLKRPKPPSTFTGSTRDSSTLRTTTAGGALVGLRALPPRRHDAPTGDGDIGPTTGGPRFRRPPSHLE